jgi:enoyl-CoA hydratase/carnithine racemase
MSVTPFISSPIQLAQVDTRFQSLQDECNATGIHLTIRHQHMERWALHISIQRAHVRNALDLNTMKALAHSLELCQQLEQETRLLAVILSGCQNYFIAGGDLKALHHLRNEEQAYAMSQMMHKSLHILESLSCVSFAAIEGFAIGGGAEIALACDMRIMSQHAFWLFPQVSLGLSTGWGGGIRLCKIVGQSRALSILIQGQKISADQACEWGLVQILSPDQDCLNTIDRIIQRIADHTEAVQAVKSLMHTAVHQPQKYLERESKIFAHLWSSDTHWQHVQNFWKAQQIKKQHSTSIE